MTAEAKISRIRIEAVGTSEESVRYKLGQFLDEIIYIDQWNEEDPGMQIVSSKSGYWGRVTVRKKSDDGTVEVSPD